MVKKLSSMGVTRKILFITGTRADFGKLKSLINKLEGRVEFQVIICVTGMHLIPEFGLTVEEVRRATSAEIIERKNQVLGDDFGKVLLSSVSIFREVFMSYEPDLIVVHGDRVESFAATSVGVFNNHLVSHIEGGELSGTNDEVVRHAISKLAHYHFVSNQKAKSRLVQMGENPEHIRIFGSPDIDLMKSANLPSLAECASHYDLNDLSHQQYIVALLHPVTTELDKIEIQVRIWIKFLVFLSKRYAVILIWPNNDPGSSSILEGYNELESIAGISIFPNLRFEYFLSLLKNTKMLVGNSSAGIRECPVYGVPTINIGSRQAGRDRHKTVYDCSWNYDELADTFEKLEGGPVAPYEHCRLYGEGNSDVMFLETLLDEAFWSVPRQKVFVDVDG